MEADPSCVDQHWPKGSMWITLRLKIAPKPFLVWSLGPKALKCESLEPQRQTQRAQHPLIKESTNLP